LRGSAAAVGALAAVHARADNRVARPLVPDPKGILELPEGFSYQVVSRSGMRMDDGYRLPGRPDAMGCFPGPGGSLVLMRNHEVFEGDHAQSPYFPGQEPPPEAYDPAGTGGVTRVILDAETLTVKRQNLVLAGTYWNCAGGLSPWGWLSCEETNTPSHGYVFLCPTDAPGLVEAKPIRGYGRMRHEAATVHPDTHVAYLTEDRPDGCFYRFVPHERDRPFEGKLQALRIVGRRNVETSEAPRGERMRVDWVDIDVPDTPDDSARLQGFAKGAARIRRGEGLWRSGDDIFFCATTGGPLGLGQVLRLRTGEHETLEVVAQSEDPAVLEMPDNLCVSPRGQVYVAEDGGGENHLRRITLDGQVIDFARNVLSGSELCGPCFSPDGRTLFVNIQMDGLTLAIRGPFEQELAMERELPRAQPRDDGPDWGRAARGGGLGLSVLALAALARARRRAVDAVSGDGESPEP
jgi:secreted PhoX family phosphatase